MLKKKLICETNKHMNKIALKKVTVPVYRNTKNKQTENKIIVFVSNDFYRYTLCTIMSGLVTTINLTML